MKAPRDRESAEIEYTSKFLKNFYFFEEVPDELLLGIVADLELKHYPAEQKLMRGRRGCQQDLFCSSRSVTDWKR